jgi:site-specific DNA-methyltransferase (adenine-specific)
MKTNTILLGDALKVLQKLPRESINMVITSPPYWALRDYGSSAECVWDGKKDCRHDWASNKFRLHSGRGNCQKNAKYSEQKNIPDKIFIHNICSKCGAWRGQLGLEPTFELYIKHLCDVFEEVKRVLTKDGTCWVNLGDTFSGSGNGTNDYRTEASKSISGKRFDYNMMFQGKQKREFQLLPSKSLCLIPFRFAIEMQKRGWIIRNVIIWHKPNCMPTSVKDRFTVDFEYLFFFVKNKRYYFEQQREPHKLESIKRTKYKWNGHREPGSSYAGMNIKKMCHPNGRNKRCVWSISTGSFRGAHFAVYPPELIETPIKAGCPENGTILDPFFGAGTTGLVALKQEKRFIGIELNPKYIKIAKKRLGELK